MKDKLMFFRVGGEEEKKIIDRAKRLGMTKSAFTRMVVLDALKTRRHICGACGNVFWVDDELERCMKCGGKNIFRQ